MFWSLVIGCLCVCLHASVTTCLPTILTACRLDLITSSCCHFSISTNNLLHFIMISYILIDFSSTWLRIQAMLLVCVGVWRKILLSLTYMVASRTSISHLRILFSKMSLQCSRQQQQPAIQLQHLLTTFSPQGQDGAKQRQNQARFHFTHQRPIHSDAKQKITTTNAAEVEGASHSPLVGLKIQNCLWELQRGGSGVNTVMNASNLGEHEMFTRARKGKPFWL